MLTNKDIDRVARRAAVEVGYASLEEYVAMYQCNKVEMKKGKKMKVYLIRFAVGLVSFAFSLAMLALPIWLLYYYAVPTILVLLGVGLLVTIYKIGKTTIEHFYEDEQIWSTIVEDYNVARQRVKQFFRRR